MSFVDGNVSVDEDFARFGSKSYAINKINSVEVRVAYPHGRTAMWAFGILAVLMLSFAAGEGGTTALIIAVVTGALALWAWKRSKLRLFQLYVMTSSSEAQAYQSQKEAETIALRDAIERAMAARR